MKFRPSRETGNWEPRPWRMRTRKWKPGGGWLPGRTPGRMPMGGLPPIPAGNPRWPQPGKCRPKAILHPRPRIAMPGINSLELAPPVRRPGAPRRSSRRSSRRNPQRTEPRRTRSISPFFSGGFFACGGRCVSSSPWPVGGGACIWREGRLFSVRFFRNSWFPFP